MGSNSGSEEKQGDSDKRFDADGRKAIMEKKSEQNAAGTQGNGFSGRLEAVINIRQPEQTQAAEKVKSSSNNEKNITYTIHPVSPLPGILRE